MRFRLIPGLSLLSLLALSALAQTADPVGVWNMQTDVQGQTTPFTLTISKEGETLKGKVSSETYGDQNLTDFKVENGTVTYTRKLDLGGQAVDMSFTGKIDGDKITGAYNLQGVELPVTGTRKKADAAK